MTKHDDHFEEFTKLKHQILDSYIVALALKLLQRPGAGERIAIVDAFAGAGRDAVGNDGSQVIAMKRAIEAMAIVKKSRPQSIPRIELFAIEKRTKELSQLSETLRPYSDANPGLVHALRGELPQYIDQIRATVGNDPTFYFLDPLA